MNEWLIPDGYVASSTPDEKKSRWYSHEAICALNISDRDAEFFVDIYFIDSEPIMGQKFVVGAKRTSRVILGEGYHIPGAQSLSIPTDTAFSVRVRSQADLAIQYTRVDTRSAKNALMSTLVQKCT